MESKRKETWQVLSFSKAILKNLNTELEDNLVNFQMFCVSELWFCKSGKDGLLTMGRKALSPSSMVTRSENVISSMSDNDIRNCNSHFWLKNREFEVQKFRTLEKIWGSRLLGRNKWF